MSFWLRVSIDTAFYKNELLRMSVHVLRTIELGALEIFKAVEARQKDRLPAGRRLHYKMGFLPGVRIAGTFSNAL
jgi:hypothetical protein